MNNAAQAEQFTVIFTAPIFAKCHIRDEVRLNKIVVVVNELVVCPAVKMQILLIFIVVGELRFEEIVYQFLVILGNGFGNSLREPILLTGKQYRKRAISPLPLKAGLFIMLSKT